MKSLLRAVVSAAGLLFGAAGVVSAATVGSVSGIGGAEYDTAGVYIFGDVTFTASTDDGGGLDVVRLDIWDDGTIKYFESFSLAVGSTATFHFDTQWPGLIGTGAPGLGVVLSDTPGSGADLWSQDPVFLPHYRDPSQCTVNCGSFGVPEPSTLLLLGASALGLALRRREPGASLRLPLSTTLAK